MSDPTANPTSSTPAPNTIPATAAPAVALPASRAAQCWADCKIVWPLHRSGHFPRRLLAQLIDALVLFFLALVCWSGTSYSPVHIHHGERTVTPFAEIPLLSDFECSWGPIDTTATAEAATSAPPVTLFRHRLASGNEITWTIHPERRWPVALVFYVVYHTAMVTAFGQTLGKRLMRLRVVRRSGGRVGVFQALLRAVGYLLAAVSYIGVGWILLDRQRRGWHDLVVGTSVADE